MMRTLLKASLMALGAACTLLFAGGFPLLGAPSLYHGGAMLLLGGLVAVLALWGALRLARGHLARLLCGLFSCFMAGIGLVMVLRYGGKALEYAGQGGIMWFGAAGMGCVAMVGVIFTGVFGFFARKLMRHRLWLAGAHLAAALVLAGGFVDFCAEERALVRQRVDGQSLLTHIRMPEGTMRELPFRLRVDNFDVEHYGGEPTYSLMHFDHALARWQRLGAVNVQGSELVFGDERWPQERLQRAPGMPRPFLVAGQQRVILQDAPVVKEYRARCHVMTQHRGRDEARDECLRVNHPLEVKGWQITLMSHERAADGTPQLVLQLRHAPGRFWALTGMLGLILCTTMWCWLAGKDVNEHKPEEAAHA